MRRQPEPDTEEANAAVESSHSPSLLSTGGNLATIERAVVTAGIMLLFGLGYFGVGLTTRALEARSLMTVVDERIPFVAGWVWAYLWAFPCALAPLFMVTCQRLFRRAALAYVLVIAVSLVVFRLFPVTSAGLRVDPDELDVSRFSEWAVRQIYVLDTANNLFPSLHLSIIGVATYAVWRAHRLAGVVLLALGGLSAASVCLIKQHFLWDVAGGIALAVFAGGMVLRPYRNGKDAPPGCSGRGCAAYAAFVGSTYAGFWLAYLHAT